MCFFAEKAIVDFGKSMITLSLPLLPAKQCLTCLFAGLPNKYEFNHLGSDVLVLCQLSFSFAHGLYPNPCTRISFQENIIDLLWESLWHGGAMRNPTIWPKAGGQSQKGHLCCSSGRLSKGRGKHFQWVQPSGPKTPETFAPVGSLSARPGRWKIIASEATQRRETRHACDPGSGGP